jgi:hypothetical protein
MLELQTEIGPFSPPEWFAPPTADRTRRFLSECERRIILHCKKLLDHQSLQLKNDAG